MYKTLKTLLVIIFLLQPIFLVSEYAAYADDDKKQRMPPNPEVYPEYYQTNNQNNSLGDKAQLEPNILLEPNFNHIRPQRKGLAKNRMLQSEHTSKTEKVLVIPLQFQDVPFEAEHTPEYFDHLFTAPSYSVKDYYEKNSNYSPGQRGITLDVSIAPVITSVHDMAYYGENTSHGIDDANGDISSMAAEAIEKLDAAGFDFSPFDTNGDGVIDHFVVIHAGEGEESAPVKNYIWSHAGYTDCQVDGVNAVKYTTTSEMSQIGTICHEFGHDLGLPDLYDTNFDEDGLTNGVGVWDIMGDGSWLALPGKPAGSCPANLSIFSKEMLGWVDLEEITQDGQYTLENTAGNDTGFEIAINESQDECFLIEYRRKQGYDAALPGEGLLVWHIDIKAISDLMQNNMVNAVKYRQGVELEQADRYYDLYYTINLGDGSDPYPGETGNENFVAIPGIPFLMNYCNKLNPKGNDTDYSYTEIRNIKVSGDTVTAFFEVEKKSPSTAPELIGPENLSLLTSVQPKLTWNLAPMATDYWVQVSEDPSFKTLTVNKYHLKYDQQGNMIEYMEGANYLDPKNYKSYCYQITPDEELESGKRYFWRVAAINPMTTSDTIKWSEVRELNTPETITVRSCVYGVTEGSEDGGILEITINGGTFVQDGVYDDTTVRLSGLPAGVKQGDVSLVNEHVIKIKLQGNSTVDYDEDCVITVTISKDNIENSEQKVDASGTVILQAIQEPSKSAPTVTFGFDGTQPGAIVGTTEQMEYSLDGGSTYITAKENKIQLSSVELANMTAANDIRVRQKATLREPAGKEQMIDILDAPAAPTLCANDTENTLSGIDQTMEYSVDAGHTWVPYGGNLPDLSGDVVVEVRKTATGTTKAGMISTVIYTRKSQSSGGGSSAATDSVSSKNPILKEISITKDQSGKVLEVVSINQAIVEQAITSPNRELITVDVQTGRNADKTELKIPAGIFNKAAEKNKKLKIITDKVMFEIEPGMFELEGNAAEVKLNIALSQPSENQSTFEKMHQEVNGVSYVFNFELTSGEQKVTTFTKPMRITVPYEPSKVKDANKVGAFFFHESKKAWEYVGGIMNPDSTISFSVEHFSKFAVLEYDKTFHDISSHWAKYDIEVMSAKQVVNGKSSGLFRPDEDINRAEFIALLNRALRVKPESETQKYSDVPVDAWYKQDVDTASSFKLVDGVGEGKFAPTANISREQAVVILVRAYERKGGKSFTPTNPSIVKDISDVASWAQEEIQLANHINLITGYPDGRFAPKDSLTRAQSVVLIKRLMDQLQTVPSSV